MCMWSGESTDRASGSRAGALHQVMKGAGQPGLDERVDGASCGCWRCGKLDHFLVKQSNQTTDRTKYWEAPVAAGGVGGCDCRNRECTGSGASVC